jgi:flagellar biogenesis protein FliO
MIAAGFSSSVSSVGNLSLVVSSLRRTLCLGLLLLATAGSLSAAETPARDAATDFRYSPNWPEPPDTSGMLLRLAFGTVVTLGLCAGTLILGRRWLQRPATGASSRKLRIEESVVLGHRATLFLVKVGDQHLVAGTDAGGLKSLIVLPTAFQEMLDQQVETVDGNSVASVPTPSPVIWNASEAKAA